MGMIVSVDPKTGETKNYFAPDTPHIRVCTSTLTTTSGLAPLTTTSSVSWIRGPAALRFINRQRKRRRRPSSRIRRPGYVWFGDLNGNNITRFDPRTETFVEYPFPSRKNPRLGIGIDPQGRIWFTEFMNGRIGARSWRRCAADDELAVGLAVSIAVLY